MGDVRYVHIPLSKEHFSLAVEVKNGEKWDEFFMRLINDEKKRKEEWT